MKVTKIVLWTLLMVAIASCFNIKNNGESQDIIEENQSVAREIIDAINLYQETNGTLPLTLDELAPVYIKVVPQTVQNDPFTYDIHEYEEYSLSFKIDKQSYCSYLYRSKFWDCGFFDNH